MTTIDAIFLGLAFWILKPRFEKAWLFALVPFIAYGAEWIPLGDFQMPLVAALLVILFKGQAAAPILLMLPEYASLLDAAQGAGMWCVAWLLLKSLEARIDDAAVPQRLRHAPVRLMLCALLYFALLPMHYL